MKQRRIAGALVAAALVSLAFPLMAGPVAARDGNDRSTDEATYVPDYMRTNKLPETARISGRKNTQRIGATGRYGVGDVRKWPANDDVAEFPVYFKKYKLKAVSRHGEFWVAKDIAFPDGDCRNDDASRIKVTRKQARYFLRQFERKMWPRETRWFSKPPKRNGENAAEFVANDFLEIDFPENYWKGGGRRVVMLIDNVRDDNFYDTDNANTLSRIAGFHWGLFNEEVDRNVMTIDSFNWPGNTTANPPHSPSEDPCLNYPANPFQYEATFAHEFQHLLEYYADPDGEYAWVDEGMADWAQTLTGYAKPWKPMSSKYYDSHIQCFLGYLEQAGEYNPIPAENCGAENSLTWWGDQTDNEVEILADYGAAYSFMEMLVDRYGKQAMRFMHNKKADGFANLEALLGKMEAANSDALDEVHEWLLMMATDKLLDAGATLHGTDADLEVKTLNAQVDWNNDDSYMTPGAPPNGGDYVLARKNPQQTLSAGDIDKITFNGADTLAPKPVAWEVDADAREGNPALTSPDNVDQDEAIVRQVTVPADNATLTFETLYGFEHYWDYGFVQVSEDGETWTSLANEATTTEHDPAAMPWIVEQLPGLTGYSGGGEEPVWTTQTFDLSAYAGKQIYLSFRHMTDPVWLEHGWWIDNVKIGETVISDGTDINAWQSLTQVDPIEVAGFTVQLVAWTNDSQHVWVGKLPLNAAFEGTLSGAALDAVIGTEAENVGIIVTFDDPTEQIFDYAPYALSVDNFEQSGGS